MWFSRTPGAGRTVFFDEVGYKELLTEAVLNGHILAPVGARARAVPGLLTGHPDPAP